MYGGNTLAENASNRGEQQPLLLEMRGISKQFPGVAALKDVSFDIRGGEVHGLVGENGAGKSTLIKILSGAYRADAGEIVISGEIIERPSPKDMLSRGMAVIYQELTLAPHLSVTENLFLGRLPRNRFGTIDWGEARRKSLLLMERLGFRVDPDVRLSELSVAQRQMVSIAGAFSRNARIIVLDEPSAVLGGVELGENAAYDAIKAGKMAATFTYHFVAPEGIQFGYKIAKGEKLDKEVVLPTHQVDSSNVDQFIGKGF